MKDGEDSSCDWTGVLKVPKHLCAGQKSKAGHVRILGTFAQNTGCLAPPLETQMQYF